MDTPDQIERSVVVAAKPERVWRALSTPQELTAWFGGKIDGEFREGNELVYVFSETERSPLRIVAVEPMTYFAYRWRPYATDTSLGIDALPSTLVEFRLEPVAEGTKLTVTESGFSQLPADVRAKSFADNSSGWTSELQKLVNYVIA